MNKIFAVSGKDIKNMTLDLLKQMEIALPINKNASIAIKPNLVVASPSFSGATTHSEIVEGIIVHLQNLNYTNIIIAESAWVGESDTYSALDVCGYTALANKYNVKLIDLKEDTSHSVEVNGYKLNVCDIVDKIDYMINVPLVKGHCQTKITCALKNMKGVIPDSEKRRFHQMGLHKPIGYLGKAVKQDLIIADAICPDPYFEEGGRPHDFNQIFGCFDPVLMDSYAAEMLGYGVNDIEYIGIAESLGVGKVMDENTKIVSISDAMPKIEIENKDEKYLNIIDERDACSSCYSALVNALHELNEVGLTEQFVGEIAIGQGFKNEIGEVGIGNCTCNFKKYVKGCPPKKEDVIEFLKNIGS